MAGFAREHALSLTLSILLHALVIGLLAYGFVTLRSRPTPQPAAQPAIEATVVDEKRVQEEAQRLEDEEKERKRQAEEERQQAEQARREREEEQQKVEDLKQQREAEEKLAQEREQQEQEAKRKADEAKRQQQAKATADKKRKEQEAKQRKDSEAELKRRLAEEERRSAAEDSGQLAQYVAQIQAQIQRKWIRPPSAREGLKCIVNVTQVPGGEVVGVKIGECNGDDAVRQSIEAAVYRASPLPEPSDPALFERNLKLEFKPGE
ncbi:MAG TPA: cell envelope integrity protein TolA [Steroidobacteraceae bacterium]|nr:cell envelope integrity protein TolA [Steroidobacteraceae bacterium]